MAINTISDLQETTSPPDAGQFWLQTDTDDYKVTLQTIKAQIQADIFDSIIPIGFTYVQLPGTQEPAQLWPGTSWSNISANFPAHFLRIEGTYDADHVAQSFGGGTQMDALQNHHHQVKSSSFNKTSGINPYLMYSGGSLGTRVYDAVDANIGTETRPLNITVRIWQRTA